MIYQVCSAGEWIYVIACTSPGIEVIVVPEIFSFL